MKIDLKPNELVINATDIKLDSGEVNKLILTNQNRIYLVYNDIVNEVISGIKDIMYFNKNFLIKNGVIIITDNKEYKFTMKNRTKWEKLFSSIY